MKALISLVLSAVLVAGQTIYLAVSAKPAQIQPKVLLACVQPMAVSIPISRSFAKREKCFLEQKRHFIDNESVLIEGVVLYEHTFGSDKINWLASKGVTIGNSNHDNYIDLEQGNILLSPKDDIVVGTSFGSIYVGAGATVFIMASNDDVVIYDLLQTKQNQVIVVVGQHKLMMKPGGMLALACQNTNTFEILERDFKRVAYHSLKVLDVDLSHEKLTAFVAKFSIASALVTIQPLKQLIASDDKQDKLILERLVRGAVLLGNLRVPARSKKTVAFSQ